MGKECISKECSKRSKKETQMAGDDNRFACNFVEN
jgi:hypothetical protein